MQQNQDQQRAEQQRRLELERQQQQQNQQNSDWQRRQQRGSQNSDWQRRQQEQQQQEALRRQQSTRVYSDRTSNTQQRDWRRYQEQRVSQYQQEQYRRQSWALQQQRLLEQQRRRAQLAYQQRYLQRLRQDQLRLQNWQYNDYGPNNYRYYRSGNYYETNRYGAQMLQQAVNSGYAEGFQAGQADRQDGWGFSPEDAIGYQDASYGYNAYYVDVNEYQYYFREGFNRGYEDGYYSRSQYGRYSNGTGSVLSAILQTILNLQLVN
ncbi:MAG TPA: hypothetical protein VHR36_11710 [Pyrinomonadaceae bacterium]|nr:hypothetical protein [Pyrinomonadaceae bacterium]